MPALLPVGPGKLTRGPEQYLFEIWAVAFCSGFRPSGMSTSRMLLRWKIWFPVPASSQAVENGSFWKF